VGKRNKITLTFAKLVSYLYNLLRSHLLVVALTFNSLMSSKPSELISQVHKLSLICLKLGTPT